MSMFYILLEKEGDKNQEQITPLYMFVVNFSMSSHRQKLSEYTSSVRSRKTRDLSGEYVLRTPRPHIPGNHAHD